LYFFSDLLRYEESKEEINISRSIFGVAEQLKAIRNILYKFASEASNRLSILHNSALVDSLNF
jgi:hypothetical protein